MKIIQDLTPVNFTPNGMKEVRGIVIHSMGGFYNGTISWFKNPDSKASAHYIISKKGEIRQMVEDKDMAWHAGVYDEPIPNQLKPNPNFYTIGIELEDENNKNWTYPVAQQKALKELVDSLKSKYMLISDDIFLHRELNPSRRTDPIGSFSRDFLRDPGGVIIDPPMDNDRDRGIKNLDEYRKVRKQGPEGNFEGYANAIISSDKELPETKKALESTQSLAHDWEVKAGNTATELAIKDKAFESLKEQLKIAQDRIKELQENPGPQIPKVYKTQLGKAFSSLADWAENL